MKVCNVLTVGKTAHESLALLQHTNFGDLIDFNIVHENIYIGEISDRELEPYVIHLYTNMSKFCFCFFFVGDVCKGIVFYIELYPMF